MKIGKAEWAAILVTLTLLSFAAGFFFGRSTVPSVVQVEGAVPVESPYSPPMEASPAVSEDVPEETGPLPSPEVEFPIDLNSADASQLEALPEIGPVLARRIVDYRETNGSFSAVDELKNVSGIGDKTYDAIKNLVKVVN